MSLLSKREILEAHDLGHKDIEVPEWGGTVRIKRITALERDEFERENSKKNKNGEQEMAMDNFRARYCSFVMVDETGERLFSSADVENLGAKSGKALQRIFTVAMDLNGIGVAELEALTKNSEPGLSDDSA